jgi:transcriptional regulator with XRE-family HTH domain
MAEMLNVEKIRALREKKGLTLQEAADAAGLKFRQRWARIESGDMTNVKLDTLYAIAGALGVKPKDLLL